MNTANYTKCWLDYKELPEEQKRACLYHPVLMAEGKTAATAGEEYCTSMAQLLGEPVELLGEAIEEPGVYMEVDPELEVPGCEEALAFQTFLISEEEGVSRRSLSGSWITGMI